MAEQRTLVTGALGCLGAWTLKALLDLGEEPVGFDLGSDEARVRLVLSEEERRPVLEHVGALFDAHATDGTLVMPYVTECFRAAGSSGDIGASTDALSA